MDIETTAQTNVTSIDSLLNELNSYIKKIEAVQTRQVLKSIISNDFKQLTELYINLGDFVIETPTNPNQIHFVNYILPEDFKTVFLLQRDVFLELNKVAIYNQENQFSEDKIEIHFKKSKTVLVDKLTDFKKLLNKFIEAKSTKILDKKIAQKITLQKNPWAVYKTQYATIKDQITQIEHQKVLAFKAISVFSNLKKIVEDVTSKHTELVKTINANENYIIKNTKELTEVETLSTYVDEQLTHQSKYNSNLYTFTEDVNNTINQLQKLDMPVGTLNGQLTYRDIDIKKRTQKWFDYNILPELMNLLGLETNLINKYQHSLVNLKNRLKLTKDKQTDIQLDTILKTLSQFKEDIKNIKSKSKKITKSLNNRVNNELLLSNIIKGQYFLDVSINSSINAESNTIIKKLQQSFIKGKFYFGSKYKSSLSHETVSNIELSTQCINQRMYSDETAHYDSLFLNNQFVGDLFFVPRKKQEEKLKSVVANWSSGINTSVLVKGKRLSGRSTFLKYSIKKFFGKEIINLKPNSDATIDGRKFNTTNDLKEALTYVKNNNLKSTRPVIIIDDLELWSDAKHSLLNNIRALIDFIETASDEVLVIAALTHTMVNHLDNRFSFSDTFSTVINTDVAETDEITDAILIRHGAAHRDLISEKEEPILDFKIKALVHKIIKKSDYNFGNALQFWTYHTFVQEDEKVMFKSNNHEFLDFFSDQEVIILKQALSFKFISEFGIKEVTATAFEADFKSALRRLINVKVLLRKENGTLYINPVVVNDVAKIITNKIND